MRYHYYYPISYLWGVLRTWPNKMQGWEARPWCKITGPFCGPLSVCFPSIINSWPLFKNKLKWLIYQKPIKLQALRIQRRISREKDLARKYKYKVVSRKTVVWAESYGKLEAEYLFQFEVLDLTCWGVIASHFSLVTSSHIFSQVFQYSIAKMNPYTDFEGSTDFHHPQKTLKQTQEEAH